MSATQNTAILRALMDGETLTPLDALNRFQCFRLGARIWELKRLGYEIESEMRGTGTGKTVAHYFMPKALAA